MKYPEDFKDDWAALQAAGRIHYRRVYRALREEGVIPGRPEDRQTARDHLQQVLHIDRNRAYSLSQGD
jgi:Tfp pilus assembly protein PilF